MAGGIIVTFLPAAVTGGVTGLALLTQAVTAILGRWWAGRHGDRHGAGRLLVPGVLLAAAGMVCLFLLGSPPAVLAGMALFGTGFGIAQNASLAVIFDRVPASGYGTASALWSVAYDAGYGLGAMGFGVLAVQTGYPIAFAITAALTLTVIPLARFRPNGR
jgi:predicted MFS family arabinose efflux permease